MATITTEHAVDRRVLFMALTSKDAVTTDAVLSRGPIEVETCPSVERLLDEMRAGCAVVLIPEEIISPPVTVELAGILAEQEAWSDLPILILTRQGADSEGLTQAVQHLGNVTLLERPVRLGAFLSAVQTALRARERQYQIREHLAERARAEASLRMADQRKDEFLATLGHELRNPLAPLLAALELLKTAHLSDPIAQRVSAMMERQIHHLVRLVNDLLEVSRITRGLVEVRRAPIDLESVLQSAVETSRPILDAAGHTLTVTLPDDPLTVSGDVVRLTQVFSNLLTNAAKYTNSGGHVRVHASRAGDTAVVTVRDDGIGIAADRLDSVFEMFTQVDRSSRRAQGGLGLGLTLVKSLVSLHGGRVEAHSAGLGRGSEFSVELPLIQDRAQVASHSKPLGPLPPLRIFIVDDNHDAGEGLGDLLRALGATVCVAHSGREALQALDEFFPDAVLLDIGMPDMDGYEVARRIRARPALRHVQLIAVTGWGQEHDQLRAQAAGFDHHVVKPPDLVLLRELLTAGRPAQVEHVSSLDQRDTRRAR
jgi:signal transduction histidine kinase/CheY-like chemotaxis protein